MKLAVEDRSIERIGVTSEASFSFKATGKAFRILSSGLYKDKILAIVRELSCNAYDAHVAAGAIDKPFKVHLPNRLEPHFTIRDYGIGLSHEDIMTLYSTYFESTKSDSNDFIGALGLGSKSPFSYVDAFTTVSYFNGIKSSYACFLNEADCPVVTRMSCEPTSEKNGLEVTIPVENHQDCTTFRERAQEVYRLFDPKPMVTGSADYTIEEREIVLERPGCWRIYKARGHDTRSDQVLCRPKAIMGKIAYPIHASSIPNLESTAHQLLSAVDIHIDFALGDLEFTAGREELSYDKKITVPTLSKRLVDVAKEVLEELSKRLATCKTLFEAKRSYGEMKASGALAGIKNGLMWQGIVIDSEYMVVPAKDFACSIFEVVTRGYSQRPFFVALDKDDSKVSFSCSNAPVFYFKDTKNTSSARSRIIPLFLQHKINIAFLVEGEASAIAEMRERLEGIEFIDYLTLPKPEVSKKKKVRFKKITSGRTDGYNPEVDVNLDDGGFYVLTANGKINNGMTHGAFQEKFKALKAIGKIPDNLALYIVPVSVSKKVVEHEDWKDFLKWMIDTARVALSDPKVQADIVKSATYKKLVGTIGDYSIRSMVSNWSLIVPRLSQGHMLGRFVTNVQSQQKMVHSGDAITRLIGAFPNLSVMPPHAPFDNLIEEHKIVFATYPLLKVLTSPCFECGDIDPLNGSALNYIKMVDQHNRQLLSKAVS